MRMVPAAAIFIATVIFGDLSLRDESCEVPLRVVFVALLTRSWLRFLVPSPTKAQCECDSCLDARIQQRLVQRARSSSNVQCLQCMCGHVQQLSITKVSASFGAARKVLSHRAVCSSRCSHG